LWTDGRTDVRTDGRTDIFPLYTIRSTFGSRPNNDNNNNNMARVTVSKYADYHVDRVRWGLMIVRQATSRGQGINELSPFTQWALWNAAHFSTTNKCYHHHPSSTAAAAAAPGLALTGFMPSDAMHKRGICRQPVSMCLCVCLSRSWIMSKRINISSKFFHHRVATLF